MQARIPNHEEHSLKILDAFESDHDVSQRLLSNRLGIALGLTNLLVKRLVRKGWVQVSNIKPNRVRYLITPAGIAEACDASLRRLQTDVIDLYQIHWPNRNAPAFGTLYFDPTRDQPQTSIHDQLEALGRLVAAGKVRAIGLSNETPYGVHEFVRIARREAAA